MSESNKTLKEQNSLQVKAYLGANLLAFWLLANGTELTDVIRNVGSSVDKFIESGTISLLICLLTTIVSGQLSSDFKYILIFRRCKNPLPACRAFSNYMEKDPRIDPAILLSRFGELPTSPKEQNRLWYKIYKQHQSDKIVNETHKNFLLLREIAGLCFLFFISLGLCSFFIFSSFKTSVIYTLGLLILFCLSCNAAKNHGIRLVTNVLAIESNL